MTSASWTAGYFSDVEYTHGYYRETAPLTLDCALLSRAKARPGSFWGGDAEDRKRPLRYLELGFGQGVSLAINAAANPGEFWGTDFLPGQALYADTLCRASGRDVKIFDEGFAETAARDDLPSFDVITIHGIFSWVTPENQKALVEIVRKQLKPGGLLYVSYNDHVGWAPSHPLRHLIVAHAGLNPGLPAHERVEKALAFANETMAAGSRYFLTNPAAKQRLEGLAKLDKRYVAHEYFNAEWRPMYFSDVAAMLQGAKLDYTASAHLLDHIDSINLTPEGQRLLAGIPQPVLRETVRDVLTNQSFRRDIWARGLRNLSISEQHQRLAGARVTLNVLASEVKFEISGALGAAKLNEDIYRTIVQALEDSEGGQGMTVAQLCASPQGSRMNAAQVIEAVMVLIGAGMASPAHHPETTETVAASCASLNRSIIERSVQHSEIQFMASPVTGTAVAVPRVHQLFMLARDGGAKTAEDLAQGVGKLLVGAPALRTKNDAAPTLKADLLESLRRDAVAFETRERLYRRLRVI